MSNSYAKDLLKIRYGNYCMMTGVKLKGLQYHHIEKQEHGGEATLQNGALLEDKIHHWLHSSVELNDIKLFYLINECLLLYKKCIDIDNIDLINEYEQQCMPLFVNKGRSLKYEKSLRSIAKGKNNNNISNNRMSCLWFHK